MDKNIYSPCPVFSDHTTFGCPPSPLDFPFFSAQGAIPNHQFWQLQEIRLPAFHRHWIEGKLGSVVASKRATSPSLDGYATIEQHKLPGRERPPEIGSRAFPSGGAETRLCPAIGKTPLRFPGAAWRFGGDAFPRLRRRDLCHAAGRGAQPRKCRGGSWTWAPGQGRGRHRHRWFRCVFHQT